MLASGMTTVEVDRVTLYFVINKIIKAHTKSGTRRKKETEKERKKSHSYFPLSLQRLQFCVMKVTGRL